MISLPSRLPDVGTTIFTVMSRLAAEHNAINLSQGFPDFSPPALLIERVTHHMAAGHNQYAPMAGAVTLREAVAAKVESLYRSVYDADGEVTITAGATQAIFTIIVPEFDLGSADLINLQKMSVFKINGLQRYRLTEPN